MRQFEAAAYINKWSNEERVTALIVSLRADALNILQIVPLSQQNDFKYLVSRFEMCYGDSHLQQVYHVQLKYRLQKRGESLQEFEADIMRLVRLAYPSAPDNFLEQLAVWTLSSMV